MGSLGSRSSVNWNAPIFKDIPEKSLIPEVREYPKRMDKYTAVSIHREYLSGLEPKHLAEKFGRSITTIYAILSGRAFPEVIPPESRGKYLASRRKQRQGHS